MFHHGISLACHVQRVALPSPSWFLYLFFLYQYIVLNRNVHATSTQAPRICKDEWAFLCWSRKS